MVVTTAAKNTKPPNTPNEMMAPVDVERFQFKFQNFKISLCKEVF